MDISGLVITALSTSFKLASKLYSYATRVKAAKGDIEALSNELFGLIGALEHLKLQEAQSLEDRAGSLGLPEYSEKRPSADYSGQAADEISGPAIHKANVRLVLVQTLEFLNELQGILLEPKGRFHATVQLLKWPLKENEMQMHLKRLERVKTYFVLSLVTDEADKTRKLADDIVALRTSIHETNENQKAVHSHNKHREIRDWLSPVDPSLTRHRLAQSRTPGTGTWFTSSQKFRSWKDSIAPSSTTLWLNGISTSLLAISVDMRNSIHATRLIYMNYANYVGLVAGAGKSFLMTAAIDELSSTQVARNDLAYFYCSFNNDESLHAETILGSLLAQVCAVSDPIYKELEMMYEALSKNSSRKPRRPELDDLVQMLVKRAESQQKFFIIIDGVNECGDPFELLQALKSISTSTDSVRILLSSINEKEIETCLQGVPNLLVRSVHPKDIEKDISLLVHSSLQSHHRLRQLSPSLKKDIATALTHGAGGMFRWVQCQLDLLSRLRTPGAIQKALNSLPPTLDKTYEDMLGRIDGEEDRALTKHILQILTFNLYPLTLSDICEMLQITPGMRTLDVIKCLTHPRDILSICGSLLHYHEESEIVTLAHHSVKSYLMSDLRGEAAYFKQKFQEGHHSMAMYCLTYLSFDAFSVDFIPTSLYPRSKFIAYAVQNWPLHAKEVEPLGEPLWTILRSFLLSADTGRRNFQNWVQLLIPGSANAKTTPPLYYAASFGLTAVVQYLLKIGVDLETRGGRAGATPINIAAYRGNLDVVKLLLEHGADPSVPDSDAGLNAVQWAKYMSHTPVVEYFEKMGYKFQRATQAQGCTLVSSNGIVINL